MFGRKPKTYDQMVTDPAFPYQVGRLIGAAEMAGHLLAKQATPDTREIGAKLQDTVGWFFVPGGPIERPANSESPTAIKGEK